MTTDFDNAVSTIAAKQARPEAVLAVQAQLAPLRARAIAGMDEWHKTKTQLKPWFDHAIDRHNAAYGVGCPSPDLRGTLDQAIQVINGALDAIMAIVAEIDKLTLYSVQQGHWRSLPGRLENSLANIGYLKELKKRGEGQLAELEGRVKDVARMPKATQWMPATQPAAPSVVTSFDPRGALDQWQR